MHVVDTYLHRVLEHGVKDMCSLLHGADVQRAGVSTLPVGDGVDKTVLELLRMAK